MLLFESDRQASAMMSSVENVPRNLHMGITMACDKYYPAPNYKTYAGRFQGLRFLKKDNNRDDVVRNTFYNMPKFKGD